VRNDVSFGRYAEILYEYLPLSEPDSLRPADSLVDLGLDSLNTVALLLRLEEDFGINLPDEELTAETFETVGSLWSVVSANLTAAPVETEPVPATTAPATPQPSGRSEEVSLDEAIAVVGMAGRFPGAPDVATLSRNLRDGVRSIREFTDEELLESGIDPKLVQDPNYVKARPILDDIKGFDADFFGFTPREAKLADPQQRAFLECAWEALEQAGYAVTDKPSRVAVFGGMNLGMYSFDRFALHPSAMEITPFEMIIGNEKDALATIVAYKLNLTGPAVSVQTFCSTSGSAMHLAVQSLRRGECDMALAGGVCIRVPDKIGYLYQEGGQESLDACIRTFDAESQGGVFGDGAAVVLLKPLRQALADRDTVLAIIRGSAMTNDGALKFSFTAPSVAGQSAAVAGALVDAGVDPADVSYVEAHGTATELGDPIEVAGLTKAYGPTERKQYCAIGSVKPNVGHLDRAAATTGLIKVVESLRHEVIPGLLHYQSPNPEIDFANSPFYVTAENKPWPRVEDRPRIAGLNSLGVGGTNIHFVVQEAPTPADRPANPRRWQLLPVSARTEQAARESCAALGRHLHDNPDDDLGDVAYTLQAGRQSFAHRRVTVADSGTAAATALGATAKAPGSGVSPKTQGRVLARHEETVGRATAFLFAGVGEHYAGLVADLYRQEPVFRRHVDECQRILDDHTVGASTDVVSVLTATGDDDQLPDLARLMGRRQDDDGDGGATPPINRTEIAHPSVFVAEYALARTLMDWGITPSLVLGYSVGEYVAACVAGVLSLPDALRLVAHRARLIAELPAGSMLAVALTSDQLRSRVPDLSDRGLDVAALNGAQLVVAGPTDATRALADQLRATGVACRELETTHAFHSRMLLPAAEPLTQWIKENVTLHAPVIPYVSNVTGELATAEQVTDPSYWAAHMCGTVRFADSLGAALRTPDLCYLELGPGKSLGAMLRTNPECGVERWPLIVSTLPAASEGAADSATVTEAIGRLWLAGVDVDWPAYHGVGSADGAGGWTPGRVNLPTYPFQRQPYWWNEHEPPRKAYTLVEDGPASPADQLDTLPRLPEARWLHLPVWRQTAPRPAVAADGAHWLVYTDAGEADTVAAELAARFVAAGGTVSFVRPGSSFGSADGGYRIRPGNAEDTLAMVAAAGLPTRVLHLWNLGPNSGDANSGDPLDVTRRGLHTLVALARTMQELGVGDWTLDVVGTGTHRLADTEPVYPERATVVGPCRMIPVECPQASARLIDLPAGSPVPVDQLHDELLTQPTDRIVALRGGRRHVPGYDTLLPRDEEQPMDGVRPPIRDGGVYLVTGGLGGIGLAMAQRLAEHYRARLVLLGRTPVPPRDRWDAVLADPASTDEVRRRLQGLRELEVRGAEFEVVAGDVANADDVRRAVTAAIERFGELNGVLHAAGVPGVGLMQFKTNAEMDKVLAPKVAGTLAIAEALRDVPVDFVALFSSIASATGALGQVDYCAANVFLDAFAQSGALPHTRVVSIGWGEWSWNGWASGLEGYEPALREYLIRHREYIGISFDEGWRSLLRVLAGRPPHVVVTSQDFSIMVEQSRDYNVTNVQTVADQARGSDRHPRPDLSTEYLAPQTQDERVIADIWAAALGLEKVGTQDNYFELGGTSLIGVGIMDSVRRGLGLSHLPAHTLYQAPTVGALAAAVGGTATAAEQSQDTANRASQQRARMQKRRQAVRAGS